MLADDDRPVKQGAALHGQLLDHAETALSTLKCIGQGEGRLGPIKLFFLNGKPMVFAS
jgi:hypothetical protein